MKRVLVVITVLLVAGASQAGLNDPAVGNASFEDIDIGDGWGWAAGPPWGETGSVWLESVANATWQGPEPTPYGNNVVRINNGGAVYQEIGTWSPDTTYEVTLWMSERHDDVTGGLFASWVVAELWGGGASGYAAEDVSLWDNTGAIWVDYGWRSSWDAGAGGGSSTFGDVTWTLNTSANNAGGLVEGDPLWIRLAADPDSVVSIDNIRVTPEPMTLALLGFGGLGLLRRRK